jgi:hypothetical protein
LKELKTILNKAVITGYRVISPLENEVNRICLEYMTPAKRSDSLIPAVYHLNSGVSGIKLASDTGKGYAKIEFS